MSFNIKYNTTFPLLADSIAYNTTDKRQHIQIMKKIFFNIEDKFMKVINIYMIYV